MSHTVKARANTPTVMFTLAFGLEVCDVVKASAVMVTGARTVG